MNQIKSFKRYYINNEIKNYLYLSSLIKTKFVVNKLYHEYNYALEEISNTLNQYFQADKRFYNKFCSLDNSHLSDELFLIRLDDIIRMMVIYQDYKDMFQLCVKKTINYLKSNQLSWYQFNHTLSETIGRSGFCIKVIK